MHSLFSCPKVLANDLVAKDGVILEKVVPYHSRPKFYIEREDPIVIDRRTQPVTEIYRIELPSVPKAKVKVIHLQPEVSNVPGYSNTLPQAGFSSKLSPVSSYPSLPDGKTSLQRLPIGSLLPKGHSTNNRLPQSQGEHRRDRFVPSGPKQFSQVSKPSVASYPDYDQSLINSSASSNVVQKVSGSLLPR